MPKKLYTLTPTDLAIFERARTLERGPKGELISGGSYFTSYYFRAPDQPNGWEFDHRIDPAWQLDVHHAPQTDHVIIGGMGSGKTGAIAMSAITHATLNESFKFLNVAPSSWQSKQMFDAILANAAGTLFEERFLYKYVERPFPKITIKYRLPNGKTVVSTLEFMTAGTDASLILTWEGDWVNIDQAEQIEDLSDLWANLGTRTRGYTRNGRKRMGRLSAIANAGDSIELWSLATLAEDYPETNLFKQISTYSNKNLNEADIEGFKRRLGYDQNRIDQYLGGKAPMPKGEEFTRALVEGCLDHNLDILMEHNLQLETPGFEVRRTREADIVHWEMPYDRTRTYLVIGDPGQGHPPLRNAPVVMAFDITDYPNEAIVLRALWWGDGGGKYQPWLDQFTWWLSYYHALAGVYDATGTQKSYDELAFQHLANVWPIDMSNIKKRGYMVTLKLIMMRKLLRLPAGIKGLVSQLLKYRLPDEKIPQDLVSTLFLLAGGLWAMGFEVPDEETSAPEPSPALENRYGRPHINRYARRVKR